MQAKVVTEVYGVGSGRDADVQTDVTDKYMTVLKVKLDKPVSLYRGQGGLK